jgi:hypothetical protein
MDAWGWALARLPFYATANYLAWHGFGVGGGIAACAAMLAVDLIAGEQGRRYRGQ